MEKQILQDLLKRWESELEHLTGIEQSANDMPERTPLQKGAKLIAQANATGRYNQLTKCLDELKEAIE